MYLSFVNQPKQNTTLPKRKHKDSRTATNNSRTLQTNHLHSAAYNYCKIAIKHSNTYNNNCIKNSSREQKQTPQTTTKVVNSTYKQELGVLTDS